MSRERRRKSLPALFLRRQEPGYRGGLEKCAASAPKPTLWEGLVRAFIEIPKAEECQNVQLPTPSLTSERAQAAWDIVFPTLMNE